jgi:isocitrate/isopropylmalate dehydrogenase
LQGGMGLAAGANIGVDHAMFEPIHGSSPKHAGKDKVNPLAMIMALKEGLDWLGHQKNESRLNVAATALEDVVKEMIAAGAPLTYDMVGAEKAASCSAVGDAVAKMLEARLGGT